MKVEEKDLYRLGETLEAKASILQVVVNYDMNLETRDCLRAIKTLYNDCLTDYVLAEKLLDMERSQSDSLNSLTSEDALVLEENDSAWMRLEYDKLGDSLKGAVEQHQEQLDNTNRISGRERLEHAKVNYEVLAWSITPSYGLPLDDVDVPPKERDQSEILEQAYRVE